MLVFKSRHSYQRAGQVMLVAHCVGLNIDIRRPRASMLFENCDCQRAGQVTPSVADKTCARAKM